MKTLQDAMAFFAVPQNCIDYIVRLRWPEGVHCPHCQSATVTWMRGRQVFQCRQRHPRRQFSVKVGTVLEDSPIPLGKWLLIMWMLMNCRNGISSYEVARTVGITQKSAWFLLHRLRRAMLDEKLRLSGIVEADETYVGGKLKNQHVSRRRDGYQKGKTPVVGMVERGGNAIAQVVEATTADTVTPLLEASIDKDSSVLVTDDYPIYDRMAPAGFVHEVINHRQDFFVRGPVHTNTIENFWSTLKRMLAGTYIRVSPKHLGAYVAEQVCRFNHRKRTGATEEQRFAKVLSGTVGKRLMWKELVA